jgi:hypothetical protein
VFALTASADALRYRDFVSRKRIFSYVNFNSDALITGR